MSKWEKGVIYTNRRPELVFWGRYIDVLLLWDGDMPSLDGFMKKNYNNILGIALQYEISQVKINFLDLNIGSLITYTYFKSTDRNGYIGREVVITPCG